VQGVSEGVASSSLERDLPGGGAPPLLSQSRRSSVGANDAGLGVRGVALPSGVARVEDVDAVIATGGEAAAVAAPPPPSALAPQVPTTSPAGEPSPSAASRSPISHDEREHL
jgi:hypothetical protein